MSESNFSFWKSSIHPNIPDDLRHLIPGFIKRRVEEVEVLKNLLQAKDFDKISRQGHKMKGHGEGYGFNVISECGALIEFHGKSANESPLIDTIAEYEKYLRFIQKTLAESDTQAQ